VVPELSWGVEYAVPEYLGLLRILIRTKGFVATAASITDRFYLGSYRGLVFALRGGCELT
jgi:hypothetical protein